MSLSNQEQLLMKACADKEYLKRIVKKKLLGQVDIPGEGKFYFAHAGWHGHLTGVCGGAWGGCVAQSGPRLGKWHLYTIM